MRHTIDSIRATFRGRIAQNTNPSANAGKLASRKVVFGPWSRFAVAPVFSRFGSHEWFVWDAENIDPTTDSASVVRQAPTIEAALTGLDLNGDA